ncbi:hypothetical protein EPUS_00248 [Endocarpon pusillum Z07020]|uniref:Swi5-domain-containing protein n=1 Tax=Endocarpon pusillum (strain Z07020 / HMAS-L-300199) TaxID=1263415 RepID=U1GEB5_ENDPU|nr:uncharacterized protein EPUS_00248 [Endocarpon pusillum Z07020]ERF70061.1 hypothetical protein EPUS_00248 [Endocarpon pusillum Z07020]
MPASKRKRGGQKATSKRAAKNTAKPETPADPEPDLQRTQPSTYTVESLPEENAAADPAAESAPSPRILAPLTQLKSSTPNADLTSSPSIPKSPTPSSPDAKTASQGPGSAAPDHPILPPSSPSTYQPHSASPSAPQPPTSNPSSANLLRTKISTLQSQTSTLQTQLSSTYAQLAAKTTPAPESDPAAKAEAILKRHIRLLHEYNEIRDVGMGLMGLIADARGVRLGEVMDGFGVGADGD